MVGNDFVCLDCDKMFAAVPANFVPKLTDCEECHFIIEWGVEKCDRCRTRYTGGYWAAKLDDWLQEDDGELKYETFDWGDVNICCNRIWKYCTCPQVINAESVYNVETEAVYQSGSDCDHCIHQSEPSCPPLREIVKDMVQRGKTPLPLTGCENFDLIVSFEERT